MNYEKNIKNWFKEKDSIQDLFEVEDNKGNLHLFEKEAVLENILVLPKEIQKKVVTQITRIELSNGNPNHFLNYLLKGLVNQPLGGV